MHPSEVVVPVAAPTGGEGVEDIGEKGKKWQKSAIFGNFCPLKMHFAPSMPPPPKKKKKMGALPLVVHVEEINCKMDNNKYILEKEETLLLPLL